MRDKSTLSLYRSCAPVVDVEYDRDGPESIVETLIGALAAAKGVDVTAVPPVYEAIDLDAIRQLFDRNDGTTETVLGFTIDVWNIFIRDDGRIRVCDRTRDTDPEPVFDGSVV